MSVENAIRPKITWPDFLQSAPYFLSPLWDLLDYSNIDQVAPLVRAAHCYDIFDAEVSNGGVMQYFYNRSDLLFFEKIPEYVAEHPLLEKVLPFIQKVHQDWKSVEPAVKAAQANNEWPEQLFVDFHPAYDALTKEFYKINHEITQSLCAAIVQSPETYFDFDLIDGLEGKGVEYVLLQDGMQRLRFEEGFPVGPNIFEYKNGGCGVVWFSAKRELLQVDMPQTQVRDWIFYPSLTSGSWRFKENQITSYQSTRALWEKHGNSETYNAKGVITNRQYYSYGQEVLFESFTDSGQLFYCAETRNDKKFDTRFWPNGVISTVSIKQSTGEVFYIECKDENGQPLIDEKGNGKFKAFLAIYEGKYFWQEGLLVDGYLDGKINKFTSLSDGSDLKIIETIEYQKGKIAK